ncbi:TIGR00730 family Rossman fold protein [Leucobacter sp. UT-8R-CII-1-4]|uniref:LOG family protein n=1 Tax=Leucobacter sp. UT-8R-CII-1-4 TaxID=3040075 RepID=UPI0024A82998|nr:TIGR00730 family Rossman fold protein [Leucobacter sp. UT-8R-CII-1-4]MDI6022266.1 TIGR00730 family Rossman fold protein [Leucobacter sp. UT-8R-CII-1-4]
MHDPKDTAAHREAVAALLSETGVTKQRNLVSRIVDSGLGLGLDETSRLNLKISAAALEEMRAAFRLFAPFAHVPKVTIFGSARTKIEDPLYSQAHDVSRDLAEQGWIVVTGAGPGIMDAATQGAGAERSLGVSIVLPFEEQPNHEIAGNDRLVSMKYFFTRKLMLVKESQGFICLPGGYGTMDEVFELLTLQQTGKMVPVPIVLLDRPDGTFWRGFERFVSEHLEFGGMISKGDLDRVLITESVTEAAAEITGFWRNYDSLRWIGDEVVLRLTAEPSDGEIAQLNEQFAHLLESGSISRCEPYREEIADQDRLELPRIVFTPKRRATGELFRVIRALNELPSAPAEKSPPIAD